MEQRSSGSNEQRKRNESGNQEPFAPEKGGLFLDRMNRILRMRGNHFVHFVNSVDKVLLIHDRFLKLARCAFETRGRAKQYSNTPALNHANRAHI
jgi:hypothetical protein